MGEERYGGDYGADYERTKTPPGLDAAAINRLNQALTARPTRTIVLPQLSATGNNIFLPTDGLIFRQDTNGSNQSVSGFANVSPGRTVYYRNVSANVITLLSESAGSLAAHRINVGALSGTIASGATALLVYDTIQQRWILVSLA